MTQVPDDYRITLADLREIQNINTASLSDNLSMILGLMTQRLNEIDATLAMLTDAVSTLAKSATRPVDGDEWKYADPGDEGE